jgi:hypothetical protein
MRETCVRAARSEAAFPSPRREDSRASRCGRHHYAYEGGASSTMFSPGLQRDARQRSRRSARSSARTVDPADTPASVRLPRGRRAGGRVERVRWSDLRRTGKALRSPGIERPPMGGTSAPTVIALGPQSGAMSGAVPPAATEVPDDSASALCPPGLRGGTRLEQWSRSPWAATRPAQDPRVARGPA